MRAELPLLNSTSSANVLVVLAIGIALAVLGALLLAIAVAIILRQRKQLLRMSRNRQSFHEILDLFGIIVLCGKMIYLANSMPLSINLNTFACFP